MKIVFFGTPDFVTPVLEKINESFDLNGIVTTPDYLDSRKKILTPNPVKAWGLKNLSKDKILDSANFNDQSIEKIRSFDADIFLTAAYGRLIPEEVLKIPKKYALNIHPSLLPKYRGPSPIQTAILNGDKNTGVTIIKMDDKLDHGPIVYQETYPLSDTDDFSTLHIKLFQKAADIISEVINSLINDKIILKEQDHNNATYCTKITKQDGFFDIYNPPPKEKVDRMIRAFYPWPTAWSRIRINNKLLIIKFMPNKMIQLEGSKKTNLKDFLNGYPDTRGLFDFFQL